MKKILIPIVACFLLLAVGAVSLFFLLPRETLAPTEEPPQTLEIKGDPRVPYLLETFGSLLHLRFLETAGYAYDEAAVGDAAPDYLVLRFEILHDFYGNFYYENFYEDAIIQRELGRVGLLDKLELYLPLTYKERGESTLTLTGELYSLPASEVEEIFSSAPEFILFCKTHLSGKVYYREDGTPFVTEYSKFDGLLIRSGSLIAYPLIPLKDGAVDFSVLNRLWERHGKNIYGYMSPADQLLRLDFLAHATLPTTTEECYRFFEGLMEKHCIKEFAPWI